MSALRGCAVAAAAAAVALVPAAPAAADDVLQAQTAATAVHVTLTQAPASSIITQSLVDDAAAYAAGAYDSGGGSDAQGAGYYPGRLVVEGPALFCSQLFQCPVAPPDYPLLADASYPRRGHAQAAADQRPVGSGPFVVTPASAEATATADGNTASTAAGGASLLAGTPLALRVGASSASSRMHTAGGALLVHVESSASDIDVAGILHIGSVHAVDDVVVRAKAKPVDTPHITVSGVTVGGVAATIDDTGVHVAGRSGPSPAQRLTQRGITVRTVGVDRHDAGTVARSTAAALEISFSAPVSGLPYVPNPLASVPPFDNVPGVNANGTYLGRVTLGEVGAVAGANAEPTFGLGGVGPLGSPTSPSTSAARLSAGGAGAGPTLPPGAGAVAGAAPQLATRPGFLHGILDGFTTDLADLYAVLALGSGALFVGWRGITELRRRRAGRTA